MIYLTERITSPLAFGLLFLSSICDAEFKVRCNNNTETGTSMKPSTDGIRGRYTVEWCTNITESDKDWDLQIFYNRRNPRICSHKNRHSAKVEYLNNISVNCTSVCLSTDIDLIFSACYRLENLVRSQGSIRTITTHNITNEYSMNTFTSSEFTGKEIDHGDYISATFFLGTIPATTYDLQLCRLSDALCYEEGKCEDATRNCSAPGTYEVRCALRGLPAAAYELKLTHRAPWADGDLARTKITKRMLFNVTSPSVEVAAVPSGGWQRRALVGAGGALAAACACAALMLAGLRLTHHPRRLAKLRKRVIGDWLHRAESKPPAPAPAAGPILLLYAREGPALTPTVRALTSLLTAVAPGQVYDLYAPSTVAAAAASGDSWLRSLMANDATKIIMLQTPALQALYTAPSSSEEPLLGGRGVYRAPEAGDRWLALALRAALQLPRPAYTQYYIATISGLETEVLPHTVPFRRYVLPNNIIDLLHDLNPATAAALTNPPSAGTNSPTSVPSGTTASSALQRQLIDELVLATRDFVDHARANPHYLMEELIII